MCKALGRGVFYSIAMPKAEMPNFPIARNLNFRFLLLVLLCVVDVTAQESASPTPTAEQVAQSPMAAVVVDGITLFSVRGVSAYPAERRAQEIADRIKAAARNRAVSKDSLRLSERPNATTIMAENQPVMTVVDADALQEGVDRQALARVFQVRIGEAIDAFRYERRPAVLSQHTFYALAATLGLLITLLSGRRILRRVQESLESRYKDRIRGIGIQSFQIVRTEQLWRVVNGLWDLFWAAALLTASYLWLDYVLSLFP